MVNIWCWNHRVASCWLRESDAGSGRGEDRPARGLCTCVAYLHGGTAGAGWSRRQRDAGAAARRAPHSPAARSLDAVCIRGHEGFAIQPSDHDTAAAAAVALAPLPRLAVVWICVLSIHLDSPRSCAVHSIVPGSRGLAALDDSGRRARLRPEAAIAGCRLLEQRPAACMA